MMTITGGREGGEKVRFALRIIDTRYMFSDSTTVAAAPK
jgi:hypothetical protein